METLIVSSELIPGRFGLNRYPFTGSTFNLESQVLTLLFRAHKRKRHFRRMDLRVGLDKFIASHHCFQSISFDFRSLTFPGLEMQLIFEYMQKS